MKKGFTLGVLLVLFSAAAAPAADLQEITAALNKDGGAVFPIGSPNTANAPYFSGDSYVSSLSDGGVPVFNVTFVNGARTVWHIHHGTCQILMGLSGKGAYQIWGQEPVELLPGQSVTIPEGVKHWHGAAQGHCFQHAAVMEPNPEASTEWLEPVR
ncbi:MAG: cupin domain-containing protein [Pyramidobacter sp.]|jgi:quercetin dioxygenase-like cupin family protein